MFIIYFLPRPKSHRIKEITPTIRITAHHIPALNIVPIASQLVRVIMAKTDKLSKLNFFIIIDFRLYINVVL